MKNSQFTVPFIVACLIHTCAFASGLALYEPAKMLTVKPDKQLNIKYFTMQKSSQPEAQPEKVEKKVSKPPVEPAPAKVAKATPVKKKRTRKPKPVIAKKARPEPEKQKASKAPSKPVENRQARITKESSSLSSASQDVVVLDLPEPKYPISAIRRGEEGTVILRIEVYEDGRPGKVQVVKTSSFKKLDKAAIKAVERAIFKPAMKKNVAVFSTTQISITFRLENS